MNGISNPAMAGPGHRGDGRAALDEAVALRHQPLVTDPLDERPAGDAQNCHRRDLGREDEGHPPGRPRGHEHEPGKREVRHPRPEPGDDLRGRKIRTDPEFRRRHEARTQDELAPALVEHVRTEQQAGLFRGDIPADKLAGFISLVANGVAVQMGTGEPTRDVDTLVVLVRSAVEPG